MIQNGLLGLALCTQFFTGTFHENVTPPSTALEQENDGSEVLVCIDGNPIQDKVIVNEPVLMDVSASVTAVYIDGEKRNPSDALTIGPENEVVAIEVENADCMVYPVESVEMIEAALSVEDGEYTICPDCQLLFSETVNQPVNAVLVHDGQPVQSCSCRNQREIQFHLDVSGTYQMYLEYEQYQTLRGKINGKREIQFRYSSQEPSVKIIPASAIQDGKITLEMKADGDDLKEVYMLVDDGYTTTRYDDFEQVELQTENGEHKTFHVTGIAIDAYGRKAEEFYQVEMDRKPPSIEAFYNSIPLAQDSLTTISDLSLFTYESEDPAAWAMSVYINDQYVSDRLEGLVWEDQDVVKVELTAIDSFQNESKRQYFFKMEKPVYIPTDPIAPAVETEKGETKEEKIQTTTSIQMPILKSSQDYVEVIRDWGIDEHHTVVLEKEKKSIVDKTKPFICILYPDVTSGAKLHAGDMARLTILNTVDYSNDYFSKIVINGETVDVKNLPKDELNNQYWEFNLSQGTNIIDATAMDDASNRTDFHETIVAEKKANHISSWIGIALAAGLVSLLWRIKKYVENLDS